MKNKKKTEQLINSKVNEVVATVKKETNEVKDAVKKEASKASRKGKAVVKAIKS